MYMKFKDVFLAIHCDKGHLLFKRIKYVVQYFIVKFQIKTPYFIYTLFLIYRIICDAAAPVYYFILAITGLGCVSKNQTKFVFMNDLTTKNNVCNKNPPNFLICVTN